MTNLQFIHSWGEEFVHLSVFRFYYWLYAQGLLVSAVGHMWYLAIEQTLAICNAIISFIIFQRSNFLDYNLFYQNKPILSFLFSFHPPLFLHVKVLTIQD